jgi:hypothetical protein
MATYIPTQKGGSKLVHNGFIYRLQNIYPNGKSYWKCHDCDRGKCRGRAIVDIIENRQFVRLSKQHNHPSAMDKSSNIKVSVKTETQN